MSTIHHPEPELLRHVGYFNPPSTGEIMLSIIGSVLKFLESLLTGNWSQDR